MFDILQDRVYRHLFAAQLVSLIGTGLATVALGLLAYDLAGDRAGLVLGTAFTLKMVTYVCLAPVMGAFADRIDRRRVLIALNLLRAAVALSLPFVDQIWQIYALIVVLHSASAGYTPTFQATIPDVLPDEARYTRALSLSRLAYDLENIASPAIAALLLLVMSYDALFLGTFAGYLAASALILAVILPKPVAQPRRALLSQMTLGARIYLATPRLRGLLALTLATAAAGALVLVNTVVLVRGTFGMGEAVVAWTMLAFGAGSMAAALGLPPLLDRCPDRPVMLGGAGLVLAVLLGLWAIVVADRLSWPVLVIAWAAIGLGYSGVLTPTGRLLRRSCHPEDRPALFAAQFALSHACWLLTYPLAGVVLAEAGIGAAVAMAAGLAALGLGAGLWLWPADGEAEIEHSHNDLPLDHPHLAGARRHRHAVIIDDLHRHWP